MAKKLYITDDRMLKLMEWAISESIAKNESDYLDKIGSARSSLHNIRTGHQSFTKEHFYAAAKLTGANINWLFGLEDNMLRKESIDPLLRMRAAMLEVEMMLKERQGLTKPLTKVRKLKAS